jgi:hypothetical protein
MGQSFDNSQPSINNTPESYCGGFTLRDEDAPGRDDEREERGRESEPEAEESVPKGVDSGSAPGEAVETGESGGPKGPEPTRYGDWERKGRCIDF